MDDLMQQIEALFYLIENQNLTNAERLEETEKLIKKELEEAEKLYYKLGLKKGMELISEHIENEFGQL